MSKLTLKYKKESELQHFVKLLQSTYKVIKVSKPKQCEVWQKVYIDVEI